MSPWRSWLCHVWEDGTLTDSGSELQAMVRDTVAQVSGGADSPLPAQYVDDRVDLDLGWLDQLVGGRDGGAQLRVFVRG